MDVSLSSSRSQIKLTRFLPPLKRMGFRAASAVSLDCFFQAETDLR
jgi:hypothetical protein